MSFPSARGPEKSTSVREPKSRTKCSVGIRFTLMTVSWLSISPPKPRPLSAADEPTSAHRSKQFGKAASDNIATGSNFRNMQPGFRKSSNNESSKLPRVKNDDDIDDDAPPDSCRVLAKKKPREKVATTSKKGVAGTPMPHRQPRISRRRIIFGALHPSRRTTSPRERPATSATRKQSSTTTRAEAAATSNFLPHAVGGTEDPLRA
mmetsp:Transcript_81683/g.229947  ORF Transcript_81683/g.229947 Transcript_81683/m.229947 type:complete len:206 (+) Transcript_81683:595-1212(+)